jgi:hypothetical protein
MLVQLMEVLVGLVRTLLADKAELALENLAWTNPPFGGSRCAGAEAVLKACGWNFSLMSPL